MRASRILTFRDRTGLNAGLIYYDVEVHNEMEESIDKEGQKT